MNGILVIDKPVGFTSHDVVARVRRILKTRSVGHTGTLDPFATGVLVCLIGKATRLAQFLDKAEKEYLATIQFGYATDTGDLTGARIENHDLSKEEITARLTAPNLASVCEKFRGATLQTPPMYSAKKIGGKKLYELARKGEEINRQPVTVNITELEIVASDVRPTTAGEQLTIRVVCSAGTYIRVLAQDIGNALGVPAHLAALRRTRAGNFHLTNALALEELENTDNPQNVLISPNNALAHLPLFKLNKEETFCALNGMKIKNDESLFPNNEYVRLSDENENLIAVAIFDRDEKTLQPRVVVGKRNES